MKKYGGQLVYAMRDAYGPLEVIEYHRRSRSLHFGNRTQQSGMFLFNPVYLIHKYTQALLTPLCWMTPKTALILGLGAGSIPKYLLHYIDDIIIDAVELRPTVVDIGKDYFNLPEEHPRFNIHISSAEDYLSKNNLKTNYFDLIIIDLFLTAKENDISVDISSYFSKLYAILARHGCLCINLLGSEYQKYKGLNQLRKEFDSNIYVVSVDTSNSILFAFKESGIFHDCEIEYTAIEKKLGLPFRQYVNKLISLG